jgi:hypothetical protein
VACGVTPRASGARVHREAASHEKIGEEKGLWGGSGAP